MVVGQLAQFSVGAVLHRVRDEHQRRVGAERLRLRLRALDEFLRCHSNRRDAARLEFRHVMRTARYAGPSVAEPLDDEVDLGRDLLLQRHRRRPRVGRLLVAPGRETAFVEPLLDTVEEHVAARLGNIQEADRQPVELVRPLQPRSYRRTSLRRRIEKHSHGHLHSTGTPLSN
jgi:hypothetical protein